MTPPPAATPHETPAVLCFDRGYAPFAAVASWSLIKASCRPVQVHWLVRPEDTDHAKRLRAALPRGAESITITAIDDALFAEWNESLHITRAAYNRLLIPSVIPAERALYLDCDVLVTGDIGPLLDLPLGDHLIGGVPNRSRDGKPRRHPVCADAYLNSGVLLMNLEAMRREGSLSKCTAIERQFRGRFRWHDQDIINAYAEGRKHVLPERWNTQVWPEQTTRAAWQQLLSSGEASILHCLGPVKPWQQWCEPYIAAHWKAHAEELRLAPDCYQTVQTLRHAILLAAMLERRQQFKASSEVKNRIILELLNIAAKSQPSAAVLDTPLSTPTPGS